METVLLIVVSVYAAVLTYLRATAPTTKTELDDKILAAAEKVEPIVVFISPKPKTK